MRPEGWLRDQLVVMANGLSGARAGRGPFTRGTPPAAVLSIATASVYHRTQDTSTSSGVTLTTLSGSVATATTPVPATSGASPIPPPVRPCDRASATAIAQPR